MIADVADVLLKQVGHRLLGDPDGLLFDGLMIRARRAARVARNGILYSPCRHWTGAAKRPSRLFGSVARGDARPDSDIDILVIVQPDDERIRLERVAFDTAFDVNLLHDVYISPRVLTPGILADPVWGQTPFLQAVQRESVALMTFVAACEHVVEQQIVDET